ncbi:MAG: M48 family metallopeptidase [Desulfobacterales bacterium]
MNFIAVIILTALLSCFVLELAADLLNLRMLRTDPPPECRGIYDPERYRRSQEYLRVNTRFGWISSGFDLLVFLLFWFAGGFDLLDRWVRIAGWGPVLTGTAYIGILLLIKSLLSLPFSVYATFVIEEGFGFNKTDWKTFAADRIKALLLSVFLGGPLLGAVLGFFEYAGNHAWWCCWLAVTIFMLLMQYAAPTWIMPLFNRFEPLEDGALKQAITDCAHKAEYPLSGVFVMDGSRRSAKSNAFFTGFGKKKRIVLFDTLIARHSVAELLAVLAHEIGHYKKKHIRLNLMIGIVHMGIVFWLLSLFISRQELFDAFYMSHPSVYAGMIFFGMLLTPIDFFLGILMQMLSRKNEFEADRFAVETTRNPEALIRALKKLTAHNLSNLLPHPLYVFLHYSHPPIRERIRAINAVRPEETSAV